MQIRPAFGERLCGLDEALLLGSANHPSKHLLTHAHRPAHGHIRLFQRWCQRVQLPTPEGSPQCSSLCAGKCCAGPHAATGDSFRFASTALPFPLPPLSQSMSPFLPTPGPSLPLLPHPPTAAIIGRLELLFSPHEPTFDLVCYCLGSDKILCHIRTTSHLAKPNHCESSPTGDPVGSATLSCVFHLGFRITAGNLPRGCQPI